MSLPRETNGPAKPSPSDVIKKQLNGSTALAFVAFMRAAERIGYPGGTGLSDRDQKLEWFKAVILPQQALLRHRLRRVVRDTQDLDDLVAEVLARTFACADWRAIRHGLAFLTRTAYNMLIDQQRREVIVSFDYMADLDGLQRSIDTDGMLDARDTLRRLETIIAALPAQARRAFVLRRVQGHAMTEIADIMGISVSTVEKHLTRALTLVTAAMTEQEDHGVTRHGAADARQDGDSGRGRGVGHPAR